MDYILACDIGSSSCKTAIMDANGLTVATEQREIPTYYPHPGWVEQNPEDWYYAFVQTTGGLLAKSGIEPNNIKGVGFIGVTHNAVLLDRQGKLLGNSILLFDIRSVEQAARINKKWGTLVLEKTLNRTDPMWSWPQLSWIKENKPEIWGRVSRILFAKDYVRHRLAESFVTDYIDAQGSSLFNPLTRQWIPEFLDDLELSPSVLPSIVSPTDVVSHVGAKAAEETGIPKGTPVVAGTSDTAAEILGSGGLEIGEGMVKLASVGRIAVVSKRPILNTAIINYEHVLSGLWYPGTSTKHAASAYRWLRDVLWPEELRSAPDVFDRMNEEAEKAPIGCEGLLFHPHLTGQWAPYYDERMRASYTGISMSHGRAHFIRALFEGVAFALYDALNQMEAEGPKAEKIILIGQGSKSDLWRRIITDIIGRQLTLPNEIDAVYGAACIVSMGVGLMEKSAAALRSIIRVKEVLDPDPISNRIYREIFTRYKAEDMTRASSVLER